MRPSILDNARSLTPPMPLSSRATFAAGPFGGILPLPTCMAECVRPSMQPIHLQLGDIHGHMQTNMISAGTAVFTAMIFVIAVLIRLHTLPTSAACPLKDWTPLQRARAPELQLHQRELCYSSRAHVRLSSEILL